MPRTSFKNIDCPVAQGAELIGDKWKIVILRNAFFGMTRFDDFLQSLNISSKVLSARLAEMVDDGILAREASETDKRAKLYSLTEKGKDLLTFTVSLAQWSERWDQKESIKFITKSSGKLVERVTLRSASGEKVRHDDIVVAQGRAKSSELSAIRKILANRV
ncbi:helix-turn-helix transcriptional regulator [Gammaproteobacteria bacterium]|nr:helix-turn-helix transcriptional regulator [Gammaproteobacteria bacterium]